MRLIGFLSLFLFVICFGSSEGAVSSHVVAPSIEGKYSSPSCPPSEYAGLPVLWSEVIAQRRRRRPYCDPLKRYRKKLRLEKRKHNRSLKNASQGVCQRSEELESKVGSEGSVGSEVKLAEESNLRAKSGRKPSIQTNHVFCPTQGCRGHNVLGPHPDHRMLVQALTMLKAPISVKCIVVTGAGNGFPRLMEQSFMVLRRLMRLFIAPSTVCAKTWVSVPQPECLMLNPIPYCSGCAVLVSIVRRYQHI